MHIIWWGFSKGTQATQSVKWSEMYKWKDDMKHPGYEPSWYVPKANVDHTMAKELLSAP